MSNHISIYEKPKMVFLDTVDVKNYVHMDRSSAIYQSLKETIQKPLKMSDKRKEILLVLTSLRGANFIFLKIN